MTISKNPFLKDSTSAIIIFANKNGEMNKKLGTILNSTFSRLTKYILKLGQDEELIPGDFKCILLQDSKGVRRELVIICGGTNKLSPIFMERGLRKLESKYKDRVITGLTFHAGMFNIKNKETSLTIKRIKAILNEFIIEVKIIM